MVTSDITAQNANKELNSSINVMAEAPKISGIQETHNITQGVFSTCSVFIKAQNICF